MPCFPSLDARRNIDVRLKRRNKQAIAINEMPEAFIVALREPVSDPELAALDHLMED
jgi:aminoglycoside/choline kinase family phosphotransferase